MTDSPAAPAPRNVTLYRNGSVYTAADPFATAMLVDGDTVAWVGSEQAATSIADASMEVIGLQSALPAPGFVDSHIHLTETGIALEGLQLAGVRSSAELIDAVADKLSGLQSPLIGAVASGTAQQMVSQVVQQAKATVEPVLERNPEVFDHLAAAGSELLAAYRSAVENQERRWTTRGTDSRDDESGPGEYIDLD